MNGCCVICDTPIDFSRMAYLFRPHSAVGITYSHDGGFNRPTYDFSFPHADPYALCPECYSDVVKLLFDAPDNFDWKAAYMAYRNGVPLDDIMAGYN